MSPAFKVKLMKSFINIIKIVSTVWFAVLLCGCVSETRGPVDEKSATYSLCKYWWRTDYVDIGDAEVEWTFAFNTDGTGRERIVRRLMGASDTKDYTFKWFWDSSSHTIVCIEYDGGGILFWSDIFIAEDILTCRMGGDDWAFYGLNRNVYYQ